LFSQPGHGATTGVWRPIAVGYIHPPEVTTAVCRYCAAAGVLRPNCGSEQGLGIAAGSHQVSSAYKCLHAVTGQRMPL
jgi:hypothetical protein